MASGERTSALVLLNPRARGGRGEELYERVRSRVERDFAPTLARLDASGEFRDAIARALGGGVRTFIAAGGDGTVSALAGALVASFDGALGELTLGAVGLGSSNDFHKPFDEVVDTVPLRLRVAKRALRDLCEVRATLPTGAETRLIFLASASMGLTAEANAFFNEDGPVLGALKRRWTVGAIQYAALRTLASYRNLEAEVVLDGKARTLEVTNLSVLKTPFLSGTLRYDTKVDDADGLLAVNVCEAMNKREAVATLLELEKGRFSGKPKRWSSQARELVLTPRRPAALECDGEVMVVTGATFRVLEARIGVLR